MRDRIRILILLFSSLRLIPHALIFLLQKKGSSLAADVNRWSDICLGEYYHSRPLMSLLQLMTSYHEFRNLFYFRTGIKGRIFSIFCRPMPTLHIATHHIGPGLFIQHGFATIIAAREIGANCWINQQVTIGYASGSGQPILGDNVTINAGAKVLGGVEVGSNSVVGANAVVVKNVPRNVTVVGVPAKIIKRNGLRVSEAL
jgi:serine O-acetyltransferase